MTTMTSHPITPVILCGGSGTRLWPLSRQSYPKQFANLMGDQSLFQRSAARASGAGFAPPLVVTGDPFRFVVVEQLAACQIAPAAILIEPDGRNTAAASLAAALWSLQSNPDAILLILPSDHIIADQVAFQAAVTAALPAALNGNLVTFGITPTRPDTGYGYLELGDGAQADAATPQPLARFVEKPSLDVAQAMLDAGHFLWNAGIFLCTARALVTAFERHAPDILASVTASVAQASLDLAFTRLDPAAWQNVRSESIDYAIMEKSGNLSVMPFGAGWSDLGNWEAVILESHADTKGNVISDNATAIDCTGTLLRSESDGLELVGIGLENMIAVAMPDAVLVAHRDDAQRVKDAVTALKARAAKQATAFASDHRPWGYFESIATGTRFQVKRIVVNPGAALSLQSHFHRSEHWIVVQGTARVTVDDTVRLLAENESVYIPLASVHRLENPGKLPMVLIEVQTGSYLGEDDIVRYEDVYARH